MHPLNTLALIWLLATLAISCAPAADSLDKLLQSDDRAAVYNAGVEAYRAERYAVARQLWQRAVDLGSHEAASNLGFLVYHGYGGPPDSLAGAAHWQQAMTRRNAEAHRHVAQAILDGDERLGTLAEAYSHAVAALALARGPRAVDSDGIDRDAQQLIDAIRPRLTSSEQAAADRLGASWARTYPGP